MSVALKIFILYYLILNILLFGMMWFDKMRAKNNGWRIPEAHLFVMALLGGAMGGLLGMVAFHHKTSKFYFYIIFFLACNLHFVLGYLMLGKLLHF